MKFLVILFTFLISISVLASDKGYQLDMKLIIDGKTVSAAQLTAEENKLASIVSENNEAISSFEVIASEGPKKNNIKLKFKVKHEHKDGSRTINSEPTFLSVSGKEAMIYIGENKEDQSMAFKVIANKKSL